MGKNNRTTDVFLLALSILILIIVIFSTLNNIKSITASYIVTLFGFSLYYYGVYIGSKRLGSGILVLNGLYILFFLAIFIFLLYIEEAIYTYDSIGRCATCPYTPSTYLVFSIRIINIILYIIFFLINKKILNEHISYINKKEAEKLGEVKLRE